MPPPKFTNGIKRESAPPPPLAGSTVPETYERDGIKFKLENQFGIQDIYEKIYGFEGAKKRIDQATTRQKAHDLSGFAGVPNYQNQTKYPLYRAPIDLALKGRGRLMAQATRGGNEADKIILSKGAGDDNILHELTHHAQPAWDRESVGGTTKEFEDRLSPHEKYQYSQAELPAWIAQAKALYFQDTKQELLPDSEGPEYIKFLDWLSDSKRPVEMQQLQRLLREKGKGEKVNRDTEELMRQIALNNIAQLPDQMRGV